MYGVEVQSRYDVEIVLEKVVASKRKEDKKEK